MTDDEFASDDRGNSDDGFDTEKDVKKRLAESELFEIAYRDDGEIRRFVVVHDEIVRPSAKPLGGPPVFRFRRIGAGDRFRVELPDLVGLTPLTFGDLPEPVEKSAAVVVAKTVDNPEDVLPVEVLIELLKREDTALIAAQTLGYIAEKTPAAVVDAVPALAVAAESGGKTREWAIYAFACVSHEYPEELLPAVDVLVDAMGTDEETVKNALSALGRVTSEYPDVATSVVDDIADFLDSDEQAVRGNAAGLLVDIAQEHPKPVVAHAETLAECLADPNEIPRTNASIALILAGEADPSAIRAQHDKISAALDNESPAVRANACTLVGNASISVSTDRLRRLQDDDPNERVREQATWALNRLDNDNPP